MKKNRIVIATLLLILLLIVPNNVYAHNAYFLQVLIDENIYQYQGAVIKDNANIWNYEGKHIEATLGNFSDIGNYPYSNNYDKYNYANDGSKAMPFTFPPKEIGKNNAKAKDINRIYDILNTLIPNINQALLTMNNFKPFETIEELINKSEELMQIYRNQGFGEYITIITDSGEKFEFKAKMIKGYSGNNSDISENKEYNDIEYITISHLITQANYSYKIKNLTIANSHEINKPNKFEIIISEGLGNFVNGIRSLLGLYSINELIYNDGIRNSKAFYKGVMANNWMKNVMNFHLIFHALAWSLIIVAVAKMLFKKNLSTINPSTRVSLMDGIKDILITSFILASIFLIINALLDINHKLVAVFYTTIPQYAGFGGVNNDYQTFAGTFMQLYYLFITIYLNFVYIYRALILSILIAAAPFFIISIMFENTQQKKLFSIWSRELISNIFLQSFHAFVFSFFLNIQIGTRGIELAIISFALIPFTRFFKELIVGKTGGFAEASAAGLGFIIAGGIMTQGKDKKKNKNNNEYTSSSAPYASNIPSKSSLDNINEPKTIDIGKYTDINQSSSANETKLDGTTQTILQPNTEINLSSNGRENEKHNYQKLKNFTINEKAINRVGKVAKGTWDVAKITTGAALTMALGSESNLFGIIGYDLAESGAKDLGEMGKDIGRYGKDKIEGLKNKIGIDDRI